MERNEPPAVGAALMAADLAAFGEWLREGRRDIEIQDPIMPMVLDGDWRAVARGARAALAGHGGRLGIHGPFMGLSLAPYDPLVRELVIARLRQGLAFAEELGGTHMVVHSPFMSFGHPAHTHTPAAARRHDIEAAHAVLEPLLPVAEAIGCALVIENIADGGPAPLLDLVRSFGTPLVRASLDTGHAAIMQGAGGPAPDQWVREAGDLLGHVHLQDTDGLLDRHWAPGDGTVSWFAVFQALAELPQRPRLVLELNSPAHVARGAAYLAGRGLAR